MKFHVLDYTGHSTMEFTESQKDEARLLFGELVERGFLPAHRGEGESDNTVSRRFSEADETLFVPHLRGG
jgi:hypothetical protein